MITTMFLLGAAAAATPAAPADVDAWVAQVNGQLQRHLRLPRSHDTGLATVTFRRGEDGRPADVRVASGSPFIARAALATVKAAGELPVMPAMMPGSQRVTFKFLVGDEGHEREYDGARLAMMASANHTNMALAAHLGSATRLAALEQR